MMRDLPEADSNRPEISDEDLVAYLDRELPTDQAVRIEGWLAADPSLRQRAEELEASWRMLDYLPASQPDPRLAQSTIELVAMKVLEQRRRGAKAWILSHRWLIRLVAIPLACVAGIGGALVEQRYEAQKMLMTLPVLVQYADLKLIDSPRWLEILTGLDSLVEAGLPLYEKSGFPELPRHVHDLEPWLENLDSLRRLSLYENYQSFQTLSPERQSELQRIGRMLSQPDSNYAQAVKAYSGLVNQIGSTELAQIQSLKDLDQRASSIRQVIHRELAIAYANRLSQEEKRSIQQWSNEFMEKHFDYFISLEDPDSEIILLLDMPSSESLIQPEDIQDLIQRFRPEGRALLEKLDENQRMKTIRLWVYTASPIYKARPQYSAQELLERFQSLPLEEQNRLIYKSSAEVLKILSNLPAASKP